MMSFVPVAVNQSRSLACRAVEVEQIQKRNMLIALAISIAIHALIVASYYCFPSPAIDMSKTIFKPSGERPWTSKPIDFENIDVARVFSGAAPNVSDVKAGKIVSVPDVLAEKKVTFASQAELKKGMALSWEAEGTGVGSVSSPGSGSGTNPIIVEEAPPDSFVPVEQQPLLVRRVAPKYPDLMLKAGIEGKVYVNIWVNKEGKPHQVRILRSDNELFNEAAIEAAKQFLFTPAYMNSGPVSVWVSVPFSFRLSKF